MTGVQVAPARQVVARPDGLPWGRERGLSALRTALLILAVPAALLIAVTAQFTVVNRLPWPGGSGPDLVLLLVAAVAVTTSPLAGALAGFAGGLGLDVAPPATHYAGEYALVFCLAGYAAGRVATAIANATGERAPATVLSVLAAAAVGGEAGKAALGLLLSDPNVTVPAISRVLPAAILYDMLLSPVALWLVSLVARRAAPERAPRPEVSPAWRAGAALRLASAGAAPGLRLAGSGQARQGQAHGGQSPARREPRLRLDGARSPSLSGTGQAGSGLAAPLLAGGRAARLNFAGSSGTGLGTGSGRGTGSAFGTGGIFSTDSIFSSGGIFSTGRGFGTGGSALGPSLFPGQAPRPGRAMPRGWLRAPRQAAPAVARRSPGKGWLRGARSSSLSGRAAMAGGARPGGARVSRRAFTAGSSRPAAGMPGPGHAGHAGHGALGARGGPAKGWLRPAASAPAPARRARPARGWLRTASQPKLNWYTKGPSASWLRRDRSPWRRHGRRLFRLGRRKPARQIRGRLTR